MCYCKNWVPVNPAVARVSRHPELNPILGGQKGFSLWRKELRNTPVLARKLRYLGISSKRHWIVIDEISNFYKGYSQVRSILRSPEVIKGQILRKSRFFANNRYYLQKSVIARNNPEKHWGVRFMPQQCFLIRLVQRTTALAPQVIKEKIQFFYGNNFSLITFLKIEIRK